MTAMELCAQLATHTEVAGEITRTFLSAPMHAVHALLRREMEALGMSVRVDAIGNLRGVLSGSGAGTLLMGSHVDTVPNGGAYDGPLGVAVALEVVKQLHGEKLPFALEVVAFSEEEGVRFAAPFLGSLALAGAMDEAMLARKDVAGITVAQAIRHFGLDPAEMSNAAITAGTFAFLEVHIEQGPVLEGLALPLAVVSAVMGQSRHQLTWTGAANHAGTTPMHLRRDALAAASEWIGKVESYAAGTAGGVATVGRIHAAPGAANVIPAECVVSLDVRHVEDAVRAAMVRHLLAEAARIGGRRGVAVRWAMTSEQPTVRMDAGLIAGLIAAIGGDDVHMMPSGAGHDAMVMARVVPSAMLFMRTPGGVSHHPAETVRAEDVDAAVQVGVTFVQALAHQRRV